jgi:hypothetical protein
MEHATDGQISMSEKRNQINWAAEQPAVRTTIVGGRPPGPGKGVGSVPRGIEVLVKKAAVDDEFKDLLLTERSGAAATIGLGLSDAEKSILDGVPGTQLEAIIANTTVSPKMRPAFAGRVAAVMLAALGVVTASGCASTLGSQPDDPGDGPPITGPEPEDAITDPSDGGEETSGDQNQATVIEDPAAGIRPDLPFLEPEEVTSGDERPIMELPELQSISGDGEYEISDGKVIIRSTSEGSDSTGTEDE